MQIKFEKASWQVTFYYSCVYFFKSVLCNSRIINYISILVPTHEFTTWISLRFNSHEKIIIPIGVSASRVYFIE